MIVKQWRAVIALTILALGACDKAPVANVASSADAGEAEELADNAVALAEEALTSQPAGVPADDRPVEDTSR